jgi:hypothetical protein
MRIVQLAVATDTENGEALYGLDEFGRLYLYRYVPLEPRRYVKHLTDRNGHAITGTEHGVNLYEAATTWTYCDGYTKGWELICEHDEPLSHPISHPEDPSK